VDNERRKRSRVSSKHSAPASVKLFVPLPEDALVPGELELIQAHLAGPIDRVFLPEEVDSDPHHGDDAPWP
jgi:hypothetical protein